MNETSRYLITQAILENNPDISKAGLQKELFLKFYGDDFSANEKEKILSHFDRISSV